MPDTTSHTQATTFLDALSAAGVMDFADRAALRTAASGQGLRTAFIEVGEDAFTGVDVIIFEDGSCFCASTEGGLVPWPLEACLKPGIAYDKSELGPILEDATAALPQTAWDGDALDVHEVEDDSRVEAWLRRMASEMPDPPQGLRDRAVTLNQDIYWEDRAGQQEAQELLSLLAFYYQVAPCTLVIRAAFDEGRPPEQKRRDKRLYEQLAQSSLIASTYEHEAMSAGAAHAEITDSSCFDYSGLIPLNTLMVWFSREVLVRRGLPVGWETDYNDQARDRQSGYSAYAESVDIELDTPLSNHERIAAGQAIKAFLEMEGLVSAFEKVRIEVGLPPLFGVGEEVPR